MKSFLLVLFSCCFLLISCKKDKKGNTDDSQDKIEVNSSEVVRNSNFDKEIQLIKDNFRSINAIKKWTVVDSVDLYESTEGGEAKFYFSNKKLQKIVAVYYGETGQAIEEYYLLDSKLSFVFRKEFRYNRPIYWDERNDEKFDFDKSIITETRSYFYKDVLFEQIKSSEGNIEILNDNLEKEQESIKTNFNKLKQMSLTRQI